MNKIVPQDCYIPVSVNDRLPKVDGFYYVVIDGSGCNNWFKDGKWFDETLNGKPSKVTHWLEDHHNKLILSEEELNNEIRERMEFMLKVYKIGENE